MTSSGKYYTAVAAVFILFFSKLPAQKESNTWYFGYGAGLDFSSGAPVPLSNPVFDAYEGCAAISDPEGNLLFYTNGGGARPGLIPNGPKTGYIWNRNHEVLYNMGDAEGGGYSAAQNSVIVPVPGSNHQYYLFTMDQQPSTVNPATQRGLSFFIIDRNLNGGLGGVAVANQMIYKNTTELLAIALHENGQDYWIVAIEQTTKNFVVIPVTVQGVQAPTLQARNAASTSPLVLKFSPDGNFLCIGRELYRFDKTTGVLSLLTLLPQANYYTYSFSPNSRYLYQLSEDYGDKLIRYEVTAANIPASKVVIADVGFIFPGYLQIGPDGNIYLNDIGAGQSVNSTTAVSIIHCPDSENPSFERTAFEFPADPGISITIGLTNFPDFLFRSFSGIPTKTDTLPFCEGSKAVLEPDIAGSHYLWSNGANTASIEVSEPGTYTVTVSDACASKTRAFFAIQNPLPRVELLPGFSGTPCYGDSVTLTAIALRGASLQWSGGETAPVVRVSAGSDYAVTVANACGTASQSISVPAENCCRIYLPNAFSPNDDGINDRLLPFPHSCIFSDYNLKLFSRWGELVFESADPALGWDGKFRNKPLPEGAFVYQLRYILQTPTGQQQKTTAGEVILLR
ncbi:MAG: gliding motility-associated C-terminal domain-containing protein [Saprospiraceae bacterium]|nr:gliding motility-associated C-terminal domain-containing protein [Saprospiraceae bacterium]